MRPALLLAAAALFGAADAQVNAGCEAQLMADSAAMNAQCCSGGSTCAAGVPTACSAACANVFMPFWNTCQAFTVANLPELVSFGRLCEASSVSTLTCDAQSSPVACGS